ncbi:MAG: serine protease [Candidatus Magasanikbacteria bacterium]|nr:serine protease [Candidatus Magasanikbacteria bacterium]
MKKVVLLITLSFIFIFGACNCGSQKNSIMNETQDFTNGTVYYNVQFTSNDYGVDKEEKRIIEKALCKLEVLGIYTSTDKNINPKIFALGGSGFFSFETENELFFLTAGHVIDSIMGMPPITILSTEEGLEKPTIFILKDVQYRIWNTSKEEDVIDFPSKDVTVSMHKDSLGIDFGILSFKKRPDLDLHATPVKWATTENLESGDVLYLFSEPKGKGKFFTKGYVTNPGEINSDFSTFFPLDSKNIFYMSNEMSPGSSGGPVFAIGKEDKKLYLVGIAVIIEYGAIGMTFRIASRIDPVIEALQDFHKQ